jgi:site-specific recombinase
MILEFRYAETPLEFALFTVFYLWAFWHLYIFTMGIYRAKLAGTLTTQTKILAFPSVLVAALIDVITQFTLAIIVFRDWPKKGEWLVTARLERYLHQPSGWRKVLAQRICIMFLDPFNYSDEAHCL